MYRKLFVFLVLTLSGFALLVGTASASWSKFSYSNLPGDTLLAEFTIDSVNFDSVELLAGPIFGMDFRFNWNPQTISLDTIISHDGIASVWGGLIYNVVPSGDTVLLAGAGVSQIPHYGRIFSAKFLYLDTTTFDSSRQWLTLIWERYNEYSMDVEEQTLLVPDQFILRQNYPNPFNPTTIIEFHLLRAGTATLSIYNLLGRKIKTIVFGRIAAGEHSYVWDGRDDRNQPMASGVYLYKLETASGSQAKKMMLMK